MAAEQMDWVHRSMVVTAANVMLARYLAGKFGASSQGMFTATLCPIDGEYQEPTAYISAGMIDRKFADMLASPEALIAGAAAMGVTVDAPTAASLLQSSDVSPQQGSDALTRLGLRLFSYGDPYTLTDADNDPIADMDSDSPIIQES